MLPERLSPDLLDQELDDERTFENDDEQLDPIKTLSVHGHKTLPNHFSKVTAATSVSDVIAVNVMNMDLRKGITMARDMDMIVDDTISLLRERPNIREDIFEEWLTWTPRLPNRDTTITDHSTLWCSKSIQELNGRLARRSHFLSKQPDQYLAENTNNQGKILLP